MTSGGRRRHGADTLWSRTEADARGNREKVDQVFVLTSYFLVEKAKQASKEERSHGYHLWPRNDLKAGARTRKKWAKMKHPAKT
jgi:hypothetical protein